MKTSFEEKIERFYLFFWDLSFDSACCFKFSEVLKYVSCYKFCGTWCWIYESLNFYESV